MGSSLRTLGRAPSLAAPAWLNKPLNAAGATESGATAYLKAAAANSLTIGGADAAGTYIQTGNRASWAWKTWPVTVGAGARHLRARLRRLSDPVSSGCVLGVVFANNADPTAATAYAGTYWWYEDTGVRLWQYHIHSWGSYGGWAHVARSDLDTLEHVLTLDGDHAEVLYSMGWGFNDASPSVYKRQGSDRLTQAADFSELHVGVVAGVRRTSGTMPDTVVQAQLDLLNQSLVPA